MNPTRRVLIAGCGYLGLAAAAAFHRAGWKVTGCTHSEESAAAVRAAGYAALACDISDPAETAARLPRAVDLVIHAASSGRGGADAYRRVYLAGATHLLSTLPGAHFIFTGSTSVYAQTGGEWVDESSSTAPDRETGRILLETESLILEKGGCIARLAGLYGPGRSVLLRRFFSGEAVLEAGGQRWINQIHRDDAATALLSLAEAKAQGIFNVVDDTPQTQREIYEWLATHFQRPLPPEGPIDPNRKRGWTSKRVSNQKLRSLSWRPAYPSFRAAIQTGSVQPAD